MARLIDADRLMEALPIVTEDKQISLYGAVADFMVMISEIPTVDAVEVVRCKDCAFCSDKRSKRYNQLLRFCEWGDRYERVPSDGNFWCANGKRRTDG